jgi:NADPH:quinone reductase-like Zn-dependent oxidoreductase
MRAIVQDAYGEAQDVLRLEEINRPVIGDDEVLVRVQAAGVDRGVWHVMAGLPYPLRIAGYGVRALTPRGTLVIVGSETGGRWLGGFDRSLRAPLLSPFVGQKLSMLASSENGEDLIVLAELIESGQVTPVIARTYPLSETPAAIQYMVDGHARGKVAITV